MRCPTGVEAFRQAREVLTAEGIDVADLTPRTLGFVGLGDMGAPMAANIARHGFEVIGYDRAGTSGRAPEGVAHGAGVAALAATADTLFLSVPDGAASLAVVGEIVGAGHIACGRSSTCRRSASPPPSPAPTWPGRRALSISTRR